MRQHFIGFDDLPSMLRGVPTDIPVYLNVSRRDVPYKSPAGMGRWDYELKAVVIDPHGQARYVYMILASLQVLYGKPFTQDPDQEKAAVVARCDSAKAIVTAWLHEHGYTVVSGHVAMPTNHLLYQTQLSLLHQVQSLPQAQAGEVA